MRRIEPSKDQWNFFISSNAEDGGLLQSWEWGELEAKEGCAFWRLAWEASGALLACCFLVERRLPFEWKYLYAPRGPVLQFSIFNFQFSNIISELEKFAREQGAVFLRVEPPYQNSKFDPTAGGRNSALKRVKSIQPEKTLRIDLVKPENALLALMHQKTRYNIGLAKKRGVRVEENNDMETFLNLLETTTARDGFRMHPREHYETILSMLDAKLFFASYHGQPLATALVVFFGRTAYYLHGASANEHRDVMAPYALHWEIMREAQRRGCMTYDLWGVDEKRWPGVTRFKKGFASDKQPMQYAGTYDLPLSSIRYKLYRTRHFFS